MCLTSVIEPIEAPAPHFDGSLECKSLLPNTEFVFIVAGYSIGSVNEMDPGGHFGDSEIDV